MAEPPTGTVTFLFTDIEGSTRMWERHPEAMQSALSRHDEILRGAIEERGGYVFKTVGDAFCAAFPTAPEATEAALEAQRTLLSAAWGEIGPLRVRMALHTGAAEVQGGDYFGPPLNRVARLLSAAHGGQVLLSLPTQELVRDLLPVDTELRDLGEHRLKDLARPERVFQLVAPGLPTAFPALRTLESRPNNLPMQPTLLVGREREVAEVSERLRSEEVRLFTLTGPGGTGKTRVGLQAAADLLEEFADGVFFVPLATLTDPGLVVSAIAQALGLRETGDTPLAEVLKEYLRDKRTLLLLDNFEQVLEATPVVTELLEAPNLKVLATSRTPLGLYGEHEHAVPPLEVPNPRHLPALEALSQYEAVRLFIERAQAAKADFTITDENAPAVAEICARLDGLPLAIELAAARIKLLPPKALLGRLGSRLKLLTGGARDLPARQRTLRGAIEWSHDLLDGGERTLFARLSVFAGGRTLEAIEAVGDAEGDLPVNALDGVSSLLDKSLLRQEEGPGDEPRFVMLETIHEYARERLEESGEAEDIKRAHAEYFLALAEEAEPLLHGPDQGVWIERLEAEHDNIRAALSWALKRGESETALRLAGTLPWFWYVRGHLSEGHQWLKEALARGGSTEASSRAKALRGAGQLATDLGECEKATLLLEEALVLSRQQGDSKDLAASLYEAGWTAAVQGNHERARALLEEGLAAARESGYEWVASSVLNALANVAASRGDFERAQATFEEALVSFRKLGDSQGVGATLTNVGLLGLGQGDFERAQTTFEEALALFQELGHEGGIAYSQLCLGLTAAHRGDPERARVLLTESLLMSKKLDAKGYVAESLEGFAALASAREETERAARLWGAAEALREALGLPWQLLERAVHEPHLISTRSELEEAVWMRAREEGRAMTMEEAVSYALEETDA
jgi:predicted ATPase/class 3 adenylate cyclase